MMASESPADRRTRIARSLELQIRIGLTLCVLFVVLGIVIIIHGWITYSPLDRQSMSLFGEYVAGVAGSLVSLASALLIYVAFVGQRLEAHQRQQEIDLSTFQVATQQFENEPSASRQSLPGAPDGFLGDPGVARHRPVVFAAPGVELAQQALAGAQR